MDPIIKHLCGHVLEAGHNKLKEIQRTKTLSKMGGKYSSSQKISNLDEMRDVCSKYSHKGIYVDKMPVDKLHNAYMNFPIPDDEEVIAFVDTSFWGNFKTGLAIGSKGGGVNFVV